MKKPLMLTVVRLLLGLVFLISTIAKFLSPAAFGESISSFGLLSSTAVPYMIYILPTLELLLGLALLFRVHVEKVALLSATLLVIFIAAAFSAVMSGVAVENCGCFGELYRSNLGVGFFIRNGVLLLLSLFLIDFTETTTENKEGVELRHF